MDIEIDKKQLTANDFEGKLVLLRLYINWGLLKVKFGHFPNTPPADRLS